MYQNDLRRVRFLTRYTIVFKTKIYQNIYNWKVKWLDILKEEMFLNISVAMVYKVHAQNIAQTQETYNVDI